MKRVLGAVASLSLGAMVVAAPAGAQAPGTSIGPRFGIAAGLAQPTGDAGDVADLGFNITGTLDMRVAAIPFPLRFDVQYNRHGLGDTPGADVDGSYSVIAGIADAVFNFSPATSTLRPYALGGVGIYRQAVDVEDFDGESETNLGLNFGGGLRIPLSGFDTYVEARYNTIFGDESGGYIPIVFGVRF